MSDVETDDGIRVTNSISAKWREPEFAQHLPPELEEGATFIMTTAVRKLILNEAGRRVNLLAKDEVNRKNLTDDEQLAQFLKLVEIENGFWGILTHPLGAGGTRTVDPIEKAAKALIERDLRPIFDRNDRPTTGTEGTKALRTAVSQVWGIAEQRAKYVAQVNNVEENTSLEGLIS